MINYVTSILLVHNALKIKIVVGVIQKKSALEVNIIIIKIIKKLKE